jgi:hypothetical protein
MRRFLVLSAVIVGQALAPTPSFATTDDITTTSDTAGLKVLFIGNSLTFFNSLPNTLATFLEVGEKHVPRVSDVVEPGYQLIQHWNDGVAQKKIRDDGPWDIVVLQGKSMESYEDQLNFWEYGVRFGKLANKAHVKPVLYETFANKGHAEIQPKIHYSYATLARKIHADVIPVGDVFYFVKEKDPSLELWNFDRLHPTPLGTYLAACVFYEYLTKRTPVGLPNIIPSHQVTGQGYSVSSEDAARLQRLAWQFYSRS